MFSNNEFQEANLSCIQWHGLPCLLTERLGKPQAVIFTNIDGELVACEVPREQLDSEETFKNMSEAGAFKCLNQENIRHDTFSLVLSVTERCNACCKYCFLDAQTSGGDMTIPVIQSSIDYVAQNIHGRTVTIAAFGGEPSIVPDLIHEMVSYGKSQIKDPLRFSITTNGYFDDEFCDFLLENDFDVSISMDGVPSVQEVQRPSKTSVKQLEKNVQRLSVNDLKIRATVTEFSAPFMLDSVKYLQGLGVTKVHFEPVTPGGRAAHSTEFTRQPDPETFSRELFRCIEYGSENDIDVISFPYMNMSQSPVKFCDGSIRNRLVVGASGVISTCVEVQNPKHPLYSALGIGYYDSDKQDFVFDYEQRRSFCRGCTGSIDRSECSSCAYNFFCANGCPTRNFRETGSTEVISQYRCKIAKMVLPYILQKTYLSTCDVDDAE